VLPERSKKRTPISSVAGEVERETKEDVVESDDESIVVSAHLLRV